MGQNDSKNQNPKSGCQHYDSKVINDYYKFYQQNTNPQFQMHLPYNNAFPGMLNNHVFTANMPNTKKNIKNEAKTSRNKSVSPTNLKVENMLKDVRISKTTMFQELLECPICMNTYDNPHVLPCQHTFCKSCIVSLKQNDKEGTNNISCPICRESHTLLNGLEGLTANYTMKKLIELESMVAEKEKVIEKPPQGKKAKCFVCFKHTYLCVCKDCAYMLCNDCLDDPNHELIIESKLSLKKRNKLEENFTNMVKPDRRHGSEFEKKYSKFPRSEQLPEPRESPVEEKLKVVLLVHSAVVETNLRKKNIKKEMYEDEYGKCSTFTKLNVYPNDRVVTLKKIIEKKFGIECDNQILVYEDKIMKDEQNVMGDFNLNQYAKIHIFDERDLEENIDEIEHELYGVYQDFSSLSDNSLTFKSIPTNVETNEYEDIKTKKYMSYVEYEAKPSRYSKNNHYAKNPQKFITSSLIEPKTYNRPDKYASQRRY